MSLRYNLQFFAEDSGEKTEAATPKKLADARKDGQVAKSREIASGLGLLGLFLLLRYMAGSMGLQFMQIFDRVYARMEETVTFWNGYEAMMAMEALLLEMFLQIFLLLGPILAAGFAISFVSELAQVKWSPTAKPLSPKLSKLNPISGFKKIISVNSVVELIKSLAKIGLIIWICQSYLKDKWEWIFLLYKMPLLQGIQLTGQVVTDLGIRISAFYMALALADYGYQKYKFAKEMRMSKQELKEEYKLQEGDPLIKQKIRQRMREASRARMMQNLPKADVVITNPTHLAVAIQYDPDKAEAPVVLAKGENYMAAKIREAAKAHDIEIVENKPLARMLYANVGVGELVPPELYQAVAEVLAFVYQLKGKA